VLPLPEVSRINGPDRARFLLVLLVLLACPLLRPPLPARASASLELYGTFHAMGLVVTLDASDDPDRDAVANVAYRISGSRGPDRQGYPLSRITGTRFVGSLFWLEPGTTYDVRVTFSDPDSDPVDGAIVQGIASTRAEIAIPAPSTSLHVSPTGSGTVCSLAAPCSLTEGLNQAGPGDEVVLHEGTYYQGEIDLPHSGTPGAPIVIRGYTGETAVLDGADPATFTWMAQGSGVYRTTVNVSDPHLVLASGSRLYPYQSLSDLQSLRWSIPGFYADGRTVYVHLEGNTDPNSVPMVVSRYRRAFYVEQDLIYFLDLTFRHYGQGPSAKAIYFDNANDNLVQGCTFAINDLGISLKEDSHRNVIQDSEFYDTFFDWPWEAVKDGSGLETVGIEISSSATGRGTVIRRNVFHDHFDGFGVCRDMTDVTSETDVYDNLIYNAGDDAIGADGHCSNVRIWGNTIHDVLVGISFAPASTGPVYAIRNLIYRTGAGNNAHTGRTFKFNTGSSELAGPTYLFHNTTDAVLPDTNGLHLSTSGAGWQLIYSRNNVWIGTDLALTNSVTNLPTDLDDDDLWNGNDGRLARWDDTYYAALDDFAAATGQESHGLSIDPGFADAGNGDYALAPSSGLIDAATVIPGINDDYVGDAPDIGAFEYDGYGFTLATNPSFQIISPGGVATYTLTVQPVGNVTTTAVLIIAASPSPRLSVGLTSAAVTPPNQVTLAVTDTSTSPVPWYGLWSTLTITATRGDVIQTAEVGLLVLGTRFYLPTILQNDLPRATYVDLKTWWTGICVEKTANRSRSNAFITKGIDSWRP
jgi:hypothetical protein